MAKLTNGDRIAYAARFLRDTGQFTGNGAQRRGTFLNMVTDRGYPTGKFCRVRWDDTDELIASAEGQYGDAEYCEDIRAHGQLCGISAIAKVGSPRFASTDL
jgi:hypothetical protein